MATGLENLKIYQLASRLEIEVHMLTNLFPKDERFRSIDQLKRSSASISNNIAESYHRRSIKEQVRILGDIAKGEAEETKRNLAICLEKGFHQNSAIIGEYTILMKMISGYIRFLKTLSEQGRAEQTNLKTYKPK